MSVSTSGGDRRKATLTATIEAITAQVGTARTHAIAITYSTYIATIAIVNCVFSVCWLCVTPVSTPPSGPLIQPGNSKRLVGERTDVRDAAASMIRTLPPTS